MKRYVCIHGHFYQPPRENPWLEAVELQDSAFPYHDWNARIDAECYSRNASSRILDAQELIAKIVNNYASISFNFGPTLLSWLEEHSPDTYEGILEADRLSRERFGHGSAMAQPYNHMIMPLASRHDKETQVRWGIRDFERRFGRAPAGMWLPETAVDLESLEVLAEHDIRFTVLSPYQAEAVRPLAPEKGKADWQAVDGGRVDPTRPYLVRLPSKRSITVFFYDGPASRAVAFEQILHRGEDFAKRLVSTFNDERDWPQLVHIATDGESYGHHHRDGDMALAYALDYLEREGLAELVNYPAYLEKHPPTHEAKVIDRSAWSCAHGVGRWFEDCGCHTGANAGWSQGWRKPLRESLDWLRDHLAPIYEEVGGELLDDCWKARDEYVDVILDRTPDVIAAFLKRHAKGERDDASDQRRLELLEMQRHAMLMYTSCGWFFDDISGIETVQVIEYAARALQLAEKLSKETLEEGFLERLEAAKSNIPFPGDGRRIYEEWVKPSRLDTIRVGAHYAVSSLFEDYEEQTGIYCYLAEREFHEVREVGNLRLAAGRATITSTVTGESAPVAYAAAHLGNWNVCAGVGTDMISGDWQRMLEDVDRTFQMADIAEVVRTIDHHFGGDSYSIRSLFRDERRKVLQRLLRDTLEHVEATYLDLHQRHASLTLLLADLGIPIPAALRYADERAVNHRLEEALSEAHLDPEQIELLLESARQRRTNLDETHLEFVFRTTLEGIAIRLERSPEDLHELEVAVQVMDLLPFEVNLWRVQNAYFRVLEQRILEGAPQKIGEEWRSRFLALAEKLGVAAEAAK